MTDYQSIHTGAEIDSGVRRALQFPSLAASDGTYLVQQTGSQLLFVPYMALVAGTGISIINGVISVSFANADDIRY